MPCMGWGRSVSHDEIINQIVRAHIVSAEFQFRDRLAVLSRYAESPIEIIMGARLLVFQRWGVGCHPINTDWSPGSIESVADHFTRAPFELFICPQREIDPYRIDFTILYSKESVLKEIAIECDGHAFHERTKEQARRDKSRDRELIARGIPVFRFTGSEIYRNAASLLDPVAAFLDREWQSP